MKIPIFITIWMFCNSVLLAQPYDISFVADSPVPHSRYEEIGAYVLNDSGAILRLALDQDGNGFLRLKMPGENWETVGNGEFVESVFGYVGSLTYSLSNDGGIAAIAENKSDLLVIRRNMPNIRIKRDPYSILSYELKEGGKLSILEQKANGEVYLSVFENIYQNQNIAWEAKLPYNYLAVSWNIGTNRYLIQVNSKDKFYSNDFYIIDSGVVNVVSRSILPSNSYIVSVTSSGKAILGFYYFDDYLIGGLGGPPAISDLVNPPVLINAGVPSESLKLFTPEDGNDRQEIITASGSLNFYSGNNKLQILSPDFGLVLPECLFPNSARYTFEDSSLINKNGQILTRAVSQDDKELSFGPVLLTPNQNKNNPVNYCPITKAQLTKKCGGSKGNKCSISTSIKDRSGAPVAKANVVVFRYGPYQADADGGYYPSPAKIVARGKTSKSGKVQIKFSLPKEKGAYLYQVVGPYGHKSLRAQAERFEIAK
jgi:hypothetical protein